MRDVLFSEKKNNVCTIWINRPEKRNALNAEALLRLRDSLVNLAEDTRVVVIRGVGERAFCSGMDIAHGSEEISKGIDPRDVFESVAACPCPVIAMIYGYALGAGCDLAAACDFRIATDSSRIGINPVKIGFIHYPQSMRRFINLIGLANTKELFLTGRFITAQRAKEMGLLNQVVPAEDLPAAVYSLAQEIAENAPLAVSGIKSILGKLLSYQELSSEAEAEMQAMMEHSWNTEDAKEGVRAFAERRKPVFKGE